MVKKLVPVSALTISDSSLFSAVAATVGAKSYEFALGMQAS